MNKKIVVPIVCILLSVGLLSGCTEEQNEPQNEAPAASFTLPDPAYVNEEVTFTDTSTDDGTIEAWSWDLDGDGIVDSVEQNPTWTYTEVGDYEITLTVTDDKGETGTATDILTVGYTPPTAMFSYTPMENITTATEITFTDDTATVDAEVILWEWDFGGEGNSTDQNPVYTFTTEGTYTVTLTVTDSNDLTDTYSVDITVTAAE
jgi:PKD repeat protein